MEPIDALAAAGISAGLGLLVGLQRQRADSALAGIRTFPLIGVLGTVCAILGNTYGGWTVGAGLLGVAGATAIGNFMRPRPEGSPGITTEVAALVMFAVGALVVIGPREAAVAVGVGVAVLLHLKPRLHGLAAKIGEQDMRTIMQFAIIAFVILPFLPDRAFPPFGVVNFRQIWLVVVLVVGIGLVGYVLAKSVPTRVGLLLTGLLGGLISSTATATAFSHRAREDKSSLSACSLIILIASCVVPLRMLVEVGAVARDHFASIAPRVAVIFIAGVVVVLIAAAFTPRSDYSPPKGRNPSELRLALGFAALYALVLIASAFAQERFGSAGLTLVAALSGLTDMDAITLSSARLAQDGRISPDLAARSMILAFVSNLIFKAAIVAVAGGRTMLFRTLTAFVPIGLVAVAVCYFWPGSLELDSPDFVK